jgi:hypothetical protein
MGVAHLVAAQPALAVLGDQRPAGQPVVDHACPRATGAAAERVGPKAHGAERTDPV